jgi:uncharacterized C2H2 Zn-finger protein
MCTDTTKDDRDAHTLRLRLAIARRAAEKKGLLNSPFAHKKRVIRKCHIDGCPGFYSKAAMTLHLKHEHANTRCTICNKVFQTTSTLRRHVSETHNKSCEPCSTCGRIVKRHKRHKMQCTGSRQKKEFSCPIESCNKAFTRSRNLVRHVNQHHNKKNKASDDLLGSC